jgi:hypothetical protein
MRIGTCDLLTAKRLVRRWHRHSDKLPCGHVFSLLLVDGDGEPHAVAIVGRPVSRMLDDGATLEVTRLATDGTRNACSMLYAAAAREGRARGYAEIITYTRTDETGASLRASGWEAEYRRDRAKQWDCPSRPREHDLDACGRVRWRAPRPRRTPRARREPGQVELWSAE